MAPSLPPPAFAHLDTPLNACDFDPHNENTLVVGGGGESKQMAVLDVSRADKAFVVSKIDLPKNEDYPTTIVVGPHKGKHALVLAGINQSKQDMEKGKNDHLRVFRVEHPSRAKADVGIKMVELSRSSMFAPPTKDDVFQKLLRVSPPYEDSQRQVGALATGGAAVPEIALFDLSPTAPSFAKRRGAFSPKKEAEDLDVLQVGPDKWQLAYCDEFDIYTVDVEKGKIGEPKCVYSTPQEDGDDTASRPPFRTLRYLTANFILTGKNMPRGGGVLLNGFRLPKTGQAKARLAVSERLPKKFLKTVGMEVRNLCPPASPSALQSDSQFVVAVIGHPRAVALYTLEHQTTGTVDMIANLHPVATMYEPKLEGISSVAFSHFVPPKTPTKRRLHLKLACTTLGNTCAVYTLPLRKLKEPKASSRKGRRPPRHRYVLGLASHAPSARGVVLVLAVVFVFLGVLLQGFMEIWDMADPVLGARHVTPARWHRTTRNPARGFVARLREAGVKPDGRAVLFGGDSPGEVHVLPHDEEAHKGARKWEDLHEREQAAWKDALKSAGHWTENMGETVFKSILFGELAGVVADAVGV